MCAREPGAGRASAMSQVAALAAVAQGAVTADSSAALSCALMIEYARKAFVYSCKWRRMGANHRITYTGDKRVS